MAPRKSVTDLSADIEKLDEQIHQLLMRRTAKLQAMKAKGGMTGTGLDPARDAATLRQLVARHDASFPLQALLRIWREIVTASLHGQAAHPVHVYAGENALVFWDLARGYFGSTLPLTGHPSASAVIHACAENPLAFGVVPFPESAENVSPWWAQLGAAGEGGPRVVARLPLAGESAGSTQPLGYAIASIPQAPTGDDTSVLFLETSAELSRTRLQSLLKQQGIAARIVAAGQEAARLPSRELLLETEGFVAEGDGRIAALLGAGGDAILRAVPVGGYANPPLLAPPEGQVV